jgi:crotonobetainyl-CoA:carnitine CoA-transferase CaiB-like acyl-CoA transferase
MVSEKVSSSGAAPEGALGGLLVADFSRVLAGPLATMILGDLGAEVVKIERPETGDDTRAWGPPWSAEGEASYYLAVNRNKQSAALDLNDPADLAVARELAHRADVVVENFRRGVMTRFGLDHETLRASNPRAISCRIAGLGTGDVAGYDFLAQAVGGLMSITGEAHGQPLKVGVALVDVMAGLHAAIGILAALHHRDRTGEGQLVQVDLMSTALFSLVNQASGYLTAGVVPSRMGNRHPSIAPYETFNAADRPFVIAVGNDGQFAMLCGAIDAAELADDALFRTNADRVQNRDALATALEARLAGKPAAAWVEILTSSGIPCGLVNDVADAFGFAERVGLRPVRTAPRADGTAIASVANPVGMSVTPPAYRDAPPRLGEDTDEIRRRFGGRS